MVLSQLPARFTFIVSWVTHRRPSNPFISFTVTPSATIHELTAWWPGWLWMNKILQNVKFILLREIRQEEQQKWDVIEPFKRFCH